MELLEYWKIIRKRLWLLVLVMLIGGAGTAYYTSQQPPQYRSTTTLFLNPAAASTLMNYQPYDGLQALARTYSEFMKTRSFASHVAQELNGALPEGCVWKTWRSSRSTAGRPSRNRARPGRARGPCRSRPRRRGRSGSIRACSPCRRA